MVVCTAGVLRTWGVRILCGGVGRISRRALSRGGDLIADSFGLELVDWDLWIGEVPSINVTCTVELTRSILSEKWTKLNSVMIAMWTSTDDAKNGKNGRFVWIMRMPVVAMKVIDRFSLAGFLLVCLCLQVQHIFDIGPMHDRCLFGKIHRIHQGYNMPRPIWD